MILKLKSVTIDKKSQLIQIKNVLAGIERRYSFNEFNGLQLSSGGPANSRSIFLIKNNVKVEKIGEFALQDFNEIIGSLKGIKNTFWFK